MSKQDIETNKEAEVVKSALAQKEEQVLAFWLEKDIFNKSLSKDAPKGKYTFYDGPPFATGLPHYGHLLAGTMKDIIPRFWTMRGFQVDRKWGWDTHGLPIENIVEKQFGLKSRKDIEDFGLEKFNEAARSKVMTYASDWKKIVPRLGRWVDMDQDYKTMDSTYTESVWWVFKTLFDKGLVYEGFKPMHLCPHCETTLSNFEVTQGYKDITDISLTAKFEKVDESGTFFLAWTTTPWTLPGNVALAVNPEMDYVKIKTAEGVFILAESRLAIIKGEYEILEKVLGKQLVGLSYKPVFDYYTKDDTIKNINNGWKVYPAEFVTTEDGTGIVHIAPAFGDDDLKLGQQYELPFIQHVGTDGRFKKEVTDFPGQFVKPIENSQAMDIEIIKFLAGKGTLFSKEKIVHSYPHCWRCDTPLLNYATSSWFVEVTKIKDKLIAANQKVNWVPADIKDGRFGKWLEGARDWAISRSRFWGAPLPIWRCKDCEKIQAIGAVEDLKKLQAPANKYFVVRHGEAENNVKGILSCKAEYPHHLTEKGRQQVEEATKILKDKKIDLVLYSPFVRTKETMEIITKALGLKPEQVIEENRLHEVNAGVLDLRPDAEYQAFFGSREEKFFKIPEGGESHTDVKNRMTEVLYDAEKKYAGKNILLVTHNTPAWLLFAGAAGMTPDQAIAMRHESHEFIKNSEVKELDFIPLPHNRNYELDLHRPYIDEVALNCVCGGKMKRVPEVFDCWFESGSMPYGQWHYPFENKDKFNPESGLLKSPIGFPAEFIGEGIDQTRGWFYSMMVLGVALFDQSPYKNVVVNGIILTEDGQKMSKHLKNYPDPMLLVNKYGADALRYYMLSSPAVCAEDLRFSEKGVDEVVKKVILRLQNVQSFYDMYRGEDMPAPSLESKNILDKWIVSRLRELIETVTKSMEHYELDRATRPFADFVDDLSTWYLRRSRDRFKSEDEDDRQSALAVTRGVILETSKALAIVMPFFAESLYQGIKTADMPESVHLCEWPEIGKVSSEEKDILTKMGEIRKAVTTGLELRAKAGLKVRQPLASLTIKDKALEGKKEFTDLLLDEVNVKAVLFNENITGVAELDTNITPELKSEGRARDLFRAIQELRKTSNFSVGEQAVLTVETNEAGWKLINDNINVLVGPANLSEIKKGTVEVVDALKIDDLEFKLSLAKV